MTQPVQDCTVTPLDQIFDLSVIKVVDNTAPVIGDAVTFTIIVTNIGNVTATNVEVEEILPSGYDYISSSTLAYSETSGIWSVGTLAPGEVAEMTITVEVLGFWGLLKHCSRNKS